MFIVGLLSIVLFLFVVLFAVESSGKNSTGFTIFTILSAILAIFLHGAVCVNGVGEDYSNGERYGKVVKLSKKGMFFKSWEGEMLTGAMSTTESGSVFPQTYRFSIKDDAIAKQLQDYMRTGKNVSLTYSQYVIAPMQFDTDYIITHINDASKPAEKQ